LGIRRASSADADLVARIASRTFIETFGPMNTAEDMHAYVAEAFEIGRVRAELEDPASVTLLLDVDSTPAGYARLHEGVAPHEIDALAPIELVRLYVDSAHHGSGAGAALMDASLSLARDRARDVMWLGVWERNHRAQKFYTKWGFERIGEQVFRLGSDEQTDWLMARRV
jgi:ribosomal protein S18 acetylase RimI-like enzyme